jgi:hypothetical protein
MGSEFFTTENTEIIEIFKGFLRVLCSLRGEALKEAHRVSYSAVSSTVTCILLIQAIRLASQSRIALVHSSGIQIELS